MTETNVTGGKRVRRSLPSNAMAYRYEVTASTVPTVPVGTHLVDRRRELVKTWEFMNLKSGEITYVTGRRGERVCNECYNAGKVEDYEHAGSHAAGSRRDGRRGVCRCGAGRG